MEDKPNEERHIRSFVLRQARMTRAQEDALTSLAPRWVIPYDKKELDLGEVFGRRAPTILEIGFGMGHATALIAQANPGINYLAVEVHGPGVGALLLRIQELGLSNIRIIQKDVVVVLRDMVPQGALAGVHIFFPDPWQKKRHSKRRLVQAEFVKVLAEHCGPDSYLYAVTDWEDYAAWMVEHIGKSGVWSNQFPLWAEPQTWRPSTSFEHKGLEKQHLIRELLYKKTAPSQAIV